MVRLFVQDFNTKTLRSRVSDIRVFTRISYYLVETGRGRGMEGGKAPARDWIKVVAGFSCARLDARRTCKKPYFFIYGRCPRRKYRGLALPVPFRLVSFRFDLSTFSLFFFFSFKVFLWGKGFFLFFFLTRFER